MYRRRIIAIFLSLALVASCFVTSVSADETDYNQIFIRINNINFLLEENVGFASTVLDPDESYTFTINAIYARASTLQNNQSLSVNFVLRAVVYYSSGNYNNIVSNLNPFPSNYNQYLNYPNGILFVQNFRDGPPYYQPDVNNKSYYGYQASFLITNTDVINTNVTCTWTNNSRAKLTIYFIIENLDIHPSFNWFVSSILTPALNTMNVHLNAIHNAIDSLNNSFVLDDNYSYNSIWYDSDNNFHIQENDGFNWLDAMYGILYNLSKPIIHQEQQEQLAKDAGFEDVLDDAYDKSDPGSFLDLLDIGDLADWNEQSFSGSLSDGFLYWFSQSCADDIDTVPVVRGEEPQVIDFYTQHMNDYWEALTDGTADQGGD